MTDETMLKLINAKGDAKELAEALSLAADFAPTEIKHNLRRWSIKAWDACKLIDTALLELYSPSSKK